MAGAPLSAGAELTLNYNRWGTAEMLQHYGFVHTSRVDDDTIDLEPAVLLRPAASDVQRCKLAWLLEQQGPTGKTWAGWEHSCGVQGWHLSVEQLPPLTIGDPSVEGSSVVQRMMIAMGTSVQ